MNLQENTYLCLGLVGKPKGLSGAFYLEKPAKEINAHLKELKEVLIGPSVKAGIHSQVISIKKEGTRYLIRLSAIPSRNVLEKSRDLSLWILFQAREEKEVKTKIYDMSGQFFGNLVEFANYGAGDLAVIEKENMGIDIPINPVFFKSTDDKGSNKWQLAIPTEDLIDLWYNL